MTNPDTGREPLYSVAMHREMRSVSGSMAALFSIGWAAAAAPVIRTSLAASDWGGLSGLAAVSLPIAGALVLLRFFFRQQPIWGSPHGLDVGAGRRARRIPWSKVGSPEWAWYAFNAPGSLPIASLEIEAEPKRVFFYASAESIERLSFWREEHRTHLTEVRLVDPVRSRSMSASPAARSTAQPTFPFLVFPIMIGLIVIVNVVLQMLRAGHALLAIGLLIVAIATIVLVVALRTPSSD